MLHKLMPLRLILTIRSCLCNIFSILFITMVWLKSFRINVAKKRHKRKKYTRIISSVTVTPFVCVICTFFSFLLLFYIVNKKKTIIHILYTNCVLPVYSSSWYKTSDSNCLCNRKKYIGCHI